MARAEVVVEVVVRGEVEMWGQPNNSTPPAPSFRSLLLPKIYPSTSL